MPAVVQYGTELTGNAGKKLLSKALDMAVGERHKAISLKKVKKARVQQIHDDACVAVEVEAIPKMDAPVFILCVILPQCLQYPQLYLCSVPVLLDGSYHFDSNQFVPSVIVGLNYFPKGTLAKKLLDLVCGKFSGCLAECT